MVYETSFYQKEGLSSDWDNVVYLLRRGDVNVSVKHEGKELLKK